MVKGKVSEFHLFLGSTSLNFSFLICKQYLPHNMPARIKWFMA
jgi:hypothetical protein